MWLEILNFQKIYFQASLLLFIVLRRVLMTYWKNWIHHFVVHQKFYPLINTFFAFQWSYPNKRFFFLLLYSYFRNLPYRFIQSLEFDAFHFDFGVAFEMLIKNRWSSKDKSAMLSCKLHYIIGYLCLWNKSINTRGNMIIQFDAYKNV
jgi:hypothetical protein